MVCPDYRLLDSPKRSPSAGASARAHQAASDSFGEAEFPPLRRRQREEVAHGPDGEPNCPGGPALIWNPASHGDRERRRCDQRAAAGFEHGPHGCQNCPPRPGSIARRPPRAKRRFGMGPGGCSRTVVADKVSAHLDGHRGRAGPVPGAGPVALRNGGASAGGPLQSPIPPPGEESLAKL